MGGGSEVDGFHVERKVDAHGNVHLDLRSYYVGAHQSGQRVTLEIQATSHCLLVWQEGTLLKTVPLRGLVGGRFSFERFVEHMVGASACPAPLPFVARTPETSGLSRLLFSSRCRYSD